MPFANSTMLYLIGNNLEEIVPKVNENFANGYKFLRSNTVVINIGKSKFIIITKRSTIFDYNDIIIKIAQESLQSVDKVKFL